MKAKGTQNDAVKSEWGVECSTCLGSSFRPDGDDFICLYCGAIIAGPWPTLTAVICDAAEKGESQQPSGECLECDDCGRRGADVTKTCCPYAEEIYEEEEIPATLCKDCYHKRCEDI